MKSGKADLAGGMINRQSYTWLPKRWLSSTTIYVSLIVVLTNVLGAISSRWLVFAGTTPEERKIISSILDNSQIGFGSPQALLYYIPLAITVPVLFGVGMSYLYARSLSKPIHDLEKATATLAQGDFSARVPYHPNIDEFNHMAQTINTIAQSLGDRDQARKALFADIAHELRNPLTVITTRLEGIEDGYLPLEQAEIALTLSQVRLLNRLVDDLRLLSLADEGMLTLRKESVHLPHFLRQVCQDAAALTQEQHINVQLECEPITLQADPNRLQQIVNNLLHNAIRHSTLEGEIDIKAYMQHGQAVVSVTNSGSGIPAEALPHVFERFYRADQSRARKSGGTGLGLAITKALVEAHMGNIEARNNPRGWATFVIRLPLET